MRGIRMLAIVAVVVVLGVLVAVPAQAGQATAAGTASAGSAQVVRNGHTFTVPSVGACSLDGALNGSSAGVTDVGIVSYGPAHSACAVDAAAHTSKSVANGTNFTLSALQSYGGPTIKVANYQVTCLLLPVGPMLLGSSVGCLGFLFRSRFRMTSWCRSRTAGGRLLANVILNEVILPSPNDGSITLNMMHIVLFPGGVGAGQIPLSGDVYVGSTACSPTS